MDAERKTRVAHRLVLVALLWPLVNMGLVRWFDASPWKLAGWGMYTTPRFGFLGMDVSGHDPAGDEWQPLAAPSEALRTAANAYLEQHRWLRRLASTKRFAAALRWEYPRWDRVRLSVSYPHLDRSTSRVVMVTDLREVQLR